MLRRLCPPWKRQRRRTPRLRRAGQFLQGSPWRLRAPQAWAASGWRNGIVWLLRREALWSMGSRTVHGVGSALLPAQVREQEGLGRRASGVPLLRMPVTPRRAVDPPVPAQPRPQPLGAAPRFGWSTAKLSPPLIAVEPEEPRMDKAIGMTPQAPVLVVQHRLHVRARFPGFKGPMGSPPRHALSAFI